MAEFEQIRNESDNILDHMEAVNQELTEENTKLESEVEFQKQALKKGDRAADEYERQILYYSGGWIKEHRRARELELPLESYETGRHNAEINPGGSATPSAVTINYSSGSGEVTNTPRRQDRRVIELIKEMEGVKERIGVLDGMQNFVLISPSGWQPGSPDSAPTRTHSPDYVVNFI